MHVRVYANEAAGGNKYPLCVSFTDTLQVYPSVKALTAAGIIDWKDFIFTVTWSKTSNLNTSRSRASLGQVHFTFYHGPDEIHTLTARSYEWLQLISTSMAIVRVALYLQSPNVAIWRRKFTIQELSK